jgi:hypothetical protein
MSPHPEDDPRLTQFLQRHAPTVPSASADLEQRIITLMEETPQRKVATRFKQRSRPSVVWLIPSAIAAGFVAVMMSYPLLRPSQPSEAEMAELQSFILENTWQNTATDHPATEPAEFYLVPDEPTQTLY